MIDHERRQWVAIGTDGIVYPIVGWAEHDHHPIVFGVERRFRLLARDYTLLRSGPRMWTAAHDRIVGLEPLNADEMHQEREEPERPPTTADRVVALLADGIPRNQADMSRELDVSSPTVSKVCGSLVQKNKIERNRANRYRLVQG